MEHISATRKAPTIPSNGVSIPGRKRFPVCKPFTICTTNGLIVDFAGPFPGTANDATIAVEVFKDAALLSLLRPNDVLIVDRGFRDAVQHMKNLGFRVAMPAMKGRRKQLPCDEANNSRFVTKLRWIVEAVHGRVAQRYRLLHHSLDNKMLPKARSICRIVGYLENKYGQRSWSDGVLFEVIIDYMEMRVATPNTLGERVQTERWNRRSTTLTRISAADLADFPQLSLDQLLILTSGPYQIDLAVSYLAEMMDDDDNINMSFVKESRNIVRLEVRSRHINRKIYKIFIEY